VKFKAEKPSAFLFCVPVARPRLWFARTSTESGLGTLTGKELLPFTRTKGEDGGSRRDAPIWCKLSSRVFTPSAARQSSLDFFSFPQNAPRLLFSHEWQVALKRSLRLNANSRLIKSFRAPQQPKDDPYVHRGLGPSSPAGTIPDL